MVDFIRKRLQVFVSSTYEDLRLERQSAVEAILTAGHIPAGMELFTAGDESQMEVIKQWIDESDVYLLILGGRYGSIEEESGKSYTHLEYEYAVSNGIPIFACVINEDAIDVKIQEHGRSIIETENPKELKEFRELVLSKMSRFWSDTKDIKISISETLSHFARKDDLVGWVRPTDQADIPALADEIARLSHENSGLRTQLASQIEPSIGGILYSQMKILLQPNGIADKLLECRTLFIDWIKQEHVTEKLGTEIAKELCCRRLLEKRTRKPESVGDDYMATLFRPKPVVEYKITSDGLTFLNLYELEAVSASRPEN